MTKKERFRFVINYFEQHMPVAETELVYHSPYEFLVGVILLALCVNIITPEFFKSYPTVERLAEASVEEVFILIRSCSYPNSKARHLCGMAQMLVNNFGGEVPESLEDLQKLPGVGRKTANVIASVVFEKPAMAVDTHVFRVSARIGLSTRSRTPYETEKQLVKYFPAEVIPLAHHWLILHGRYTCLARKPKCNVCGLTSVCRYYQQTILKTS